MTGTSLRISQDLGPAAQSCILDPAALAEAAGLFQRAMRSRVDVLIANRFGEQEVNGRGLRAEIAEAAAAGFVVVTGMKARYRDAWVKFGGEYAVILEPAPLCIREWVLAAVARRSLTPMSAA